MLWEWLIFLDVVGVVSIGNTGDESGRSRECNFQQVFKEIFVVHLLYISTLSRFGEPLWTTQHTCSQGASILVGGNSYFWQIGSIFKGRVFQFSLHFLSLDGSEKLCWGWALIGGGALLPKSTRRKGKMGIYAGVCNLMVRLSKT